MVIRLVYGMLVLLVALAPLPLGANRPWAWSLMAAITGGLVALWALAAAVNPRVPTLAWRRYRAIGVAWAAALLWFVVQASPLTPEALHAPLWARAAALLDAPYRGAISVDPGATLTGAMRLAAYGGIFLLALHAGGRGRRARLMLWVLITAVTAYAVYALAVQFSGAQTVLWFKRSYWDVVSGTFVNRNHFAVHAGLGMILVLAFLVEELRRAAGGVSLRTMSGLRHAADSLRLPAYVLGVLMVVLLTALVLTASRAGVAATAIGTGVMLLVLAFSGRISKGRTLRLGAALALVLLVTVSVSGEWLVTRFSGLGANLGERAMVYERALAAVADRPLTGTGLGTFADVFPVYRDAAFGANAPVYDYAHNTYLELALEAGVPALAVMLSVFAVLIAVFARGVRRRRRNVVVPAAGLGTTALVGTHAAVDFSIQIPAIAATYAFIAGIAYAQSWRADERLGAPSQVRE